MGGLLFIDEAYKLGGGDRFAEEALTTILAALTEERYKGMVVVMAGYEKEMDQMFLRNSGLFLLFWLLFFISLFSNFPIPGLKSRFHHFLDFLDWSPNDCRDQIIALADQNGFEKLSQQCQKILKKVLFFSLFFIY